MLSAALISHEDKPNIDFTLMLMQWGQFVDHDITHTPLNKGWMIVLKVQKYNLLISVQALRLRMNLTIWWKTRLK